MNAPARTAKLPPREAREPAPAVPGWLRRAVGSGAAEDAALVAGAALGALDAVVRRNEPWAGVWRQRLALAAAAATAKDARRIEGEAELRDALHLTRPGDDVGPAGRMLLAWRRLAGEPPSRLLAEESLARLAGEFGLAPRNEAIADLAMALDCLAAGPSLVEAVRAAVDAGQAHGFGRAGGAFLADVTLARRLGWSHAVPLLGTDLRRGADTLPALSRAALRAIDLAEELGRRAERLVAVAPKLRAKAAASVVERLLGDDALAASAEIPGISDRGLRRLFDRLVELGAVRELSGRPTFRIYGL